jgi:hypothetical protein
MEGGSYAISETVLQTNHNNIPSTEILRQRGLRPWQDIHCRLTAYLARSFLMDDKALSALKRAEVEGLP